MKKSVFSLLIICLFVISCSSNKEQITLSGGEEFEIQVRDSLQIDYLGELSLWDVSPSGKFILFRDYQRQLYVIVNRDGEIISSFTKDGDLPDSHGYLLQSAHFSSDNSIFAAGMKGIFEYDLQGNLLSKKAFKDPISKNMFYYPPHQKIIDVEWNNQKYFLSPVINQNPFNKLEPEYYQNYRLLSLINQVDGSTVPIIGLEPDSRFFDGKVYEITHLNTIYNVIDNKIWLNVAGEPRLLVYELSEDFPKILDLSIPINQMVVEEGKSPQESDAGSIELDTSIGGLKSINSYNDWVLISYSQGVKKEVKDEANRLWREDETAGMEFYRAALANVEQGIKVLSKNGEILGSIPTKANGPYSQMQVFRNSLWMVKNQQDREEDFTVIYKGDIGKK
jgi:hypothetical protein